MKKQNQKIYLNSKQIYEYDRITTEKFLIPSFVLMENAGRSAAEIVKKFAQKNNLKKIIVFCGPGKNGADGFVLARYLYIWNFKTKVIIFVDETNYRNEILQNYMILKKLGVIIEMFNIEKIKKEITKYDIVVDAIFGIGLKRKVEAEYKDAIDLINRTKKIVFSIDIPSGIQSDTAEILGCCIKADYTLTMGFLKLAFKNKKIKKLFGKIKLIDIGYPKVKIE